MSKSRGNVYYIEDLLKDGYTADEIRFFLIYGHYRKKLDYTKEKMDWAAKKIRELKKKIKGIKRRTGQGTEVDLEMYQRVKETFTREMDQDLDVERAFDQLSDFIGAIEPRTLKPKVALGLIKGLREVDGVLKVLF